ncbi:uncharacterized protein LOC143913729 isoform X3 [Arctopsyche grandis]|uniref:uncharacterized protein LOC143913729 isoform X3 n=1 Tax=Arctopsyche grandis TaxID=121162 RepID=UPI00406D80B6
MMARSPRKIQMHTRTKVGSKELNRLRDHLGKTHGTFSPQSGWMTVSDGSPPTKAASDGGEPLVQSVRDYLANEPHKLVVRVLPQPEPEPQLSDVQIIPDTTYAISDNAIEKNVLKRNDLNNNSKNKFSSQKNQTEENQSNETNRPVDANGMPSAAERMQRQPLLARCVKQESHIVLPIDDSEHDQEDGPHPSSQIPNESCKSLSPLLNKNVAQSSCKPRETMISIVPDAPNILMIPNKVLVKRCDGGSCFGQSACLPTRTEQIPIAVRKHDFSTGREYCGEITMIQDTRCQCGCSVMEHHCTENQVYKREKCKCMCKNSDDQYSCPQNKKWNDKSCSCICREEDSQCSTGTEWVPRMCGCMRVMTDNDVGFY